jgi:hypothetical protein
MKPARKKLLLILGGVAVVGVGFVLWRRHQAAQLVSTPQPGQLQPPTVLTFPVPGTVPIKQAPTKAGAAFNAIFTR